jgi:hypothetical protein
VARRAYPREYASYFDSGPNTPSHNQDYSGALYRTVEIVVLDLEGRTLFNELYRAHAASVAERTRWEIERELRTLRVKHGSLQARASALSRSKTPATIAESNEAQEISRILPVLRVAMLELEQLLWNR